MGSSYSTMKNALKPLRLYNFNNTVISYELSAYSVAINNIRDEFLTILRECFLNTACSYGLSDRECIIGAKRTDLSVTQRRNMLMLRENINSYSFTPDKIKQALKSFNLNCKVMEFPNRFLVVVDATGNYSKSEEQWITAQIERIMPAHLVIEVIFNGITWNMLDERDLTFNQIDSADKTWDEIDKTEQEG